MVIELECATRDEILTFFLLMNPMLSARNAFTLLHNVTREGQNFVKVKARKI